MSKSRYNYILEMIDNNIESLDTKEYIKSYISNITDLNKHLENNIVKLKSRLKAKETVEMLKIKMNISEETSYSRGNIYYADLGDTIGSEQGGMSLVVIVQNDIGDIFSPTVIVAPISTKNDKYLKMMPTHIKSNIGVIMTEQLRTIDKSRLINKVATLQEREMDIVDDKLMISVGIDTSVVIRNECVFKNNKIKRGDIFLVDFGDNKGSEQNGIRPSLVIQNDIGNYYSPTTIVSIISSKSKNKLPMHYEIDKDTYNLKDKSICKFEQIRVIDKSRIIKKLYSLNKKDVLEINNSLSISLNI